MYKRQQLVQKLLLISLPAMLKLPVVTLPVLLALVQLVEHLLTLPQELLLSQVVTLAEQQFQIPHCLMLM